MAKRLALMILVVSFCFAFGFSYKIIGGRYADDGEFPEVVYISNGEARCSASIIGPRTLLTAAHCINDEGAVKPVSTMPYDYVVHARKETYRATCTISDKWTGDQHKFEHDMALCLIDHKLTIKPATVVAQGEGPQVGETVTHVGFGCVTSRGRGGNDGRLKIGEANVYQLSDGDESYCWESKGDGICYGDSGGPGYRRLTEAKTQQHIVLGVNSRGNIYNINILTDLASEKSHQFMRDWAEANQTVICGVNKDCGE